MPDDAQPGLADEQRPLLSGGNQSGRSERPVVQQPEGTRSYGTTRQTSNDAQVDVEPEENGSVPKPIERKKPITPLPWGQLLIVCFIRLAEPISFTVIFPFINQQIDHLHIAPDAAHVGYYAGLVESCFAGTQCLTVLGWGRLSDIWGRRPVILTGIAGVMISTLSFGFSKSFAWMLVSRCINGAINGNVAALKSVVGEITDETNAASAFAFLPLFWAIGAIIGPALGGYLPEPAKRFPKLFGGVWLWEEYEYLLPCLVASGITAVGWVAGLLFLEETLDSKVQNRKRLTLLQAEADLRTVEETGDALQSSSSTLVPKPTESPPPPPPSLMAVLSDGLVGRTLLSYFALALIAVSHDAIWVLWLFTPLGSGGLGFSTALIGTMLSLYGALSVGVQLVLFPPIQRRLGSVLFFRIFLCGYALVCLAAIMVNKTAVSRAQPGGLSAGGDRLVISLVASIILLKALSNTCFSCVSLLVNSSASERSSLGTVNGLGQMTASGARAVGPAMINSIFAFGASRHIWNGELAWYTLFALCIVSSGISMTVKDGVVERKRLALLHGQ